MIPSADNDGHRQTKRFPFAVPMSIELSTGFFRPAERVDATLVDLSADGAAIVTDADPRLRLKKRYRVFIDDHAGIIEVRNVVELEEGGRIRLGVVFKSLGLELQELVADSVQRAQTEDSRLDRPTRSPIRDPFGRR